eukprot:Rhum_TRINITY_DN15001_c0_g2::Rhum_TRINITY_DN15001_c0_g2_i1::g.133207::m.133207
MPLHTPASPKSDPFVTATTSQRSDRTSPSTEATLCPSLFWYTALTFPAASVSGIDTQTDAESRAFFGNGASASSSSDDSPHSRRLAGADRPAKRPGGGGGVVAPPACHTDAVDADTPHDDCDDASSSASASTSASAVVSSSAATSASAAAAASRAAVSEAAAAASSADSTALTLAAAAAAAAIFRFLRRVRVRPEGACGRASSSTTASSSGTAVPTTVSHALVQTKESTVRTPPMVPTTRMFTQTAATTTLEHARVNATHMPPAEDARFGLAAETARDGVPAPFFFAMVCYARWHNARRRPPPMKYRYCSFY